MYKSVKSQLFAIKHKLIENTTQAEVGFRQYLDDLGIKYRFQKGIYTRDLNNFNKKFRIADFYISRCRLIIEIDGGYHNSEWGQKYDEYRNKELKNQRRNTKIGRFTNDEVMDIDNEQQIKSLLKYIKEIQVYREKGGKLNREKDLIKDKDVILSLFSFGLIE